MDCTGRGAGCRLRLAKGVRERVARKPQLRGKEGPPHVLNGKRIAVVLPAYNAATTLAATVEQLPDAVDTRILVDDGSRDETVAVARRLGLTTFVHDGNYGYGRNQMTC
jgi:hypothetical protein